MPDEPIYEFSVNLGGGDEPPGDSGSGAKMPDWGKGISSMASSLAAIQKGVASLVDTTRSILAAVQRGGFMPGSSAGTAVGIGAAMSSASKINVERIKHIDPHKAIVPFRVATDWANWNKAPNWSTVPATPLARWTGLARISSQSWGPAAGAAAETIIDAEWTDAAPAGTPGASPRKATGTRPPPKPVRPRGRRMSSFMGLGRSGSALVFAANALGLTANAGFAAAAGSVLGVGATVMASSYIAMSMRDAGATALRNASAYSPTAAKLQADVDVSRMMSSIRVANSAPVTFAAAVYARSYMDSEAMRTGWAAIWESTKLYAGAAFWGLTRDPLLSRLAAAIGKAVGTGNDAANNPLYFRDVDAMVGGMLSLQESRMTDHRGRPFLRTDTRWRNGTWVRRGHVRR